MEGKEGEREGGSFSAFPPLLVSHRSSFLPPSLPPTPQTHPAVIFLADEAEPNVYASARWGGDGGGSDVTAIPLSVSGAELHSPSQPRYLRGSRAPEGPWRVGDVRAVGGRRTRSPRGAVIKKSCIKEK